MSYDDESFGVSAMSGSAEAIDIIRTKVKPKHGDIIFVNVRGAVPNTQLTAFRRHLNELAHELREKHQRHVWFVTLNIPEGVDIQTVSVGRMKNILHDNKLVPNPDGTMIATLQHVDDDGVA